MKWRQGEHVVSIAATGKGKSVLLRALSWERDYVAWLSTKKKDEEYDRMLKMGLPLGYTRYEKWPIPKPPRDQRYQRALIWPPYKHLGDVYTATPLFKKLLENVYEDEGWTVVLDDMFWLSEMLKLKTDIAAINYQVRSLGATLLSALQRPRKIPLETWDQASHAFLRPLSNYEDMLTVRSLCKDGPKALAAWLGQLKMYEWLYLPVAKFDECEPCIVKPPLTPQDIKENNG